MKESRQTERIHPDADRIQADAAHPSVKCTASASSYGLYTALLRSMFPAVLICRISASSRLSCLSDRAYHSVLTDEAALFLHGAWIECHLNSGIRPDLHRHILFLSCKFYIDIPAF